jgi:hypothetical protein
LEMKSVCPHVTFSEEKFRSNGTLDGLMPEEHEEYDGDTDVYDEDCDVSLNSAEYVCMRIHSHPLKTGKLSQGNLSLLRMSVWKKCATKMQRPPSRNLVEM